MRTRRDRTARPSGHQSVGATPPTGSWTSMPMLFESLEHAAIAAAAAAPAPSARNWRRSMACTSLASLKSLPTVPPRSHRRFSAAGRVRQLRTRSSGRARTALEARDERVPRLEAGVYHDVPQALGVDHEPRASVQRHARLGRRVGQAVLAALHQEHVRVGVVGELQPRAHDPAVGRRVEAVVVVAVEGPDRGVVILRLELDRAHPAEVGADALHVRGDVGQRSAFS